MFSRKGVVILRLEKIKYIIEMKKLVLLLAVLLGFLSSCKDENDSKIISYAYYLVNDTDISVKMSGDNTNKYLVPHTKSKIICDKYGRGEFEYIDSKKLIIGDFVLIYGNSNEDGKYLQVIDYELKVSDSVETEESDNSIKREYHFKITDDVLRDIENIMKAKGYSPQLLKDQEYEQYFL